MIVYLLLIILLLVAVGGWPSWGYHSWGYTPSSIVGIVLIVLCILLLAGRL